jgi:hypothetical protein
MWQFNLVMTPDFQISIPNPTLTVFAGETALFEGTASALNGYTNSVTFSCSAGLTAPPNTCSASPSALIPASKTPFAVTVGGTAGDYSFKVQGVGSDAKTTTHFISATLHIVSFAMTAPAPASVTVPRGTASSTVSFQVTAAGSFSQSVTISCSSGIPNATCALTPSGTVSPTSTTPANMTASVGVPSGTSPGSYPVTLQASTAGTSTTLSQSFTVNVTSNPDFILTGPSGTPEFNVGSSTGTTAQLSIAAQDGFSGTVILSCATIAGAGSCSISPTSVSSFPGAATLTIKGASVAAGTYSLSITGTSGSVVHSRTVSFNVGDYSIAGTQALSLAPGGHGTASLTLASSTFYSGQINATCDPSALAGAMCVLSPANPINVASGGSATLTAIINLPNDALPGSYPMNINTHDITGAPGHPFTILVTLAQNFTLTSSTSSQTVTAGQTTGPYNLTVQPIGTSFPGPVTFSCTSGLPAGAQCLFSPSTPVTPGKTPQSVVMTISTAAKKAAMDSRSGRVSIYYALWLMLPGIVIGWSGVGKRLTKRKSPVFGARLLLLLTLSLLSCGGVSSGGGTPPVTPPPSGTQPVTYQITVTGVSAGTVADAGHSVVVTLVVD